MNAPINPFPEHRRGLWRVQATPNLSKERWSAGPFGDRWRALKAKLRQPERHCAERAEALA